MTRIQLGQLFSALALLFSAGCVRVVDPCREGSRWNESLQACVRSDGSLEGERPGEDGGLGPMQPALDAAVMLPAMDAATPDPDSSMDAQPEAAAGDASDDDATIDADLRDASELDGSLDAGDASDASEPDAQVPLSCSPDDEFAWRAFHLSGALIQSIGECFAEDPIGCSRGLCPMDDCLRGKAGVVACNDCVTAEVQCMLTHCVADCGSNDTNDKCRACACAEGCVAAFDACAPEPLDVCSDCNESTCGLFTPLAPELIMVIVDGLLH